MGFELQISNKSHLKRNRYLTFEYPMLSTFELHPLMKKIMWLYPQFFSSRKLIKNLVLNIIQIFGV